MAHSAQKPELFRWKRRNKKVHLTDMDINTWIKRVEMASEFAISEVFSQKKPHAGKARNAVSLLNMEQLHDHDEAYTEARDILNSWMNQKLHPELEFEFDEYDDELMGSKKNESSPPVQFKSPPCYSNFNEMYVQLARKDESLEVHNILQELMETELLESGMAKHLRLDSDMEKRKGPNPSVTMEVRHMLVKERRAQRDAAREKMLSEQEALKEARKQAMRLEHQEQRKKKQEVRRQEELLQQEIVRLRREMEDKRNMEQLARKLERADRTEEKLDNQSTIAKASTQQPDSNTHMRLIQRDQEVESKVRIHNLQCMQKHFSAWYSVVLKKSVRLGKAAALCDWRRQLRAWRAWRALVWIKRQKKEAERTEEELRLDHRRCQLAEDSDRRRLLRRCLSDWRLWCLIEKERKELLRQQEETRQKMTALIDAASSGKLAAVNCADQAIISCPEGTIQSERAGQRKKVNVQRPTLATIPAAQRNRRACTLTQAWQVTHRHAALSPAEIHKAQKLYSDVCGGQFEHRHAAQQRTIAEQRSLLREQQEVIAQLQEKQNLLKLRQDSEKAEAAIKTTVSPKDCSSHCDFEGGCLEARVKEALTKDNARSLATEEHRPVAPHPALQAMQERARLRAERRKEIEEIKRRREEEKLAKMKAEEEEHVRKAEEEKQIAAEMKRKEIIEKKRLELEKQKRTEHEKLLRKQAKEHYHMFLVLHRGWAPWKQLVQLNHANEQKAVVFHKRVLLRRCLLFWLQAADEASTERNARADQLYKHILLRRALSSWKRFRELQSYLEKQAELFYVEQTQRKFFTALLEHTTNERLVTYDKEQRADEHNNRRTVHWCFQAWRRFPAVMQAERERESRRDNLRRKVAEILPDFHVSPLDSFWNPSPYV